MGEIVEDGTTIIRRTDDGGAVLTRRGVEWVVSRDLKMYRDLKSQAERSGFWKGLGWGTVVGGSIVWATYLLLRTVGAA